MGSLTTRHTGIQETIKMQGYSPRVLVHILYTVQRETNVFDMME
jgi:hypothetical protein